ncbi:hypothetical protein BpHYR1_011869 [Brachionus plicatilis]|uniref:Uncharacterized protein n=1 Tax=Brachionus plicatilis TaxID=10195 RepID=A0A3M7SYI4_BRAPC|nr:hypothetical protein BpHYR1_011869 [Brachionus plicatilis]
MPGSHSGEKKRKALLNQLTFVCLEGSNLEMIYSLTKIFIRKLNQFRFFCEPRSEELEET